MSSQLGAFCKGRAVDKHWGYTATVGQHGKLHLGLRWTSEGPFAQALVPGVHGGCLLNLQKQGPHCRRMPELEAWEGIWESALKHVLWAILMRRITQFLSDPICRIQGTFRAPCSEIINNFKTGTAEH